MLINSNILNIVINKNNHRQQISLSEEKLRDILQKYDINDLVIIKSITRGGNNIDLYDNYDNMFTFFRSQIGSPYYLKYEIKSTKNFLYKNSYFNFFCRDHIFDGFKLENFYENNVNFFERIKQRYYSLPEIIKKEEDSKLLVKIEGHE